MLAWFKRKAVEKSEKNIKKLVAELIMVANRIHFHYQQNGEIVDSDNKELKRVQNELSIQLMGPIPLQQVKMEIIDPALNVSNVTDGAKIAVLHVYDSVKQWQSKKPESSIEGSPAFNKGVYHMDRGEWLQASEAFTTVVNDEPADFVSWYNLAICQINLGEIDKALKSLQEAITRRPKFVEALSTLGYVYNQRREWTKASEVLEKAIDIKPNYVDAWFNLGVTIVYSGSFRKYDLQTVFKRLNTLDPDSANSLKDLVNQKNNGDG